MVEQTVFGAVRYDSLSHTQTHTLVLFSSLRTCGGGTSLCGIARRWCGRWFSNVARWHAARIRRGGGREGSEDSAHVGAIGLALEPLVR